MKVTITKMAKIMLDFASLTDAMKAVKNRSDAFFMKPVNLED